LSSASGDWIAVAVLGRPWGNRGELTAVSLSSQREGVFLQILDTFLAGETLEQVLEFAHISGPCILLHGGDCIRS